MMWFYKLKRSVRVIIAVVAWLPVFIFCGIIGGDIGENAENLQTWQAIIFLLLLAVGIVFTVFAVRARNREKQAEREARAATEPQPQKPPKKRSAIDIERDRLKKEIVDNQAHAAELRAQIAAMEQADPTIAARAAATGTMSDAGITARIDNGVTLPMYTKAVGVTFDNRQEHIQKSNIGDALLIKHTPSAEYPESVSIINARTRQHLGHIKSELARSLLNEFDEGFILDGVIADITGGGDGQNYGCNIEITDVHIDE